MQHPNLAACLTMHAAPLLLPCMQLLDCRASAAAVSAVKGSPLHAAVANKDMGVVDMLLHHHASPWQADGTGRSAWDEAMTANWQEGINR